MAAAIEHEVALPAGVLHITVAAASDLGMVRKVNEDSYLAEQELFLVADGMGGHSFGDRASQSVVSTFAAALAEGSPLSPEGLVRTIHQSNQAVVNMADDDDESVSGTTLAGLALVKSEATHHWMAFNVGDSPGYSWDGRLLEQVTVGGKQLFVVCSDGLTKELDDDQIAVILADRFTLPGDLSVAERLVEAALAAGGSDNVTVVVVESDFVGATHTADEDTNDRGVPHHLEVTRPRK